jgi:hypothetical protein
MSVRKRRIYVAGAYSSDNVVGVFTNMRRGIRLATTTFQAGAIPFTPWLDYHFSLSLDESKGIPTIEDYYQYSMSFLENWAEAVLVQQQGWTESKGTINEINRARELGLPVFFSLESLLKWIKDQDAADELEIEHKILAELCAEAQQRGEYNNSKES